ncbi:golgin subfamily A member 2-like [Dipodomys spectabilis]|uniref:golgin subfamily A member 2-like n=1 Tax=Dipodomys spectabilis TaxID=105255 RepID=UPI001C53453C|nr:golgin subfamily A member 2-like [Dipodomys spectabilis]
MSKKTSRNPRATDKKLLHEYQQTNCPGGPAESKEKDKTKAGRNPKVNTTGDCISIEGVVKDHNDPEPPPPLGTSRATSVNSITGPHSMEDFEKHYQCLLLALHASRTQNQQLCSEVQHLKQEKKALQGQSGKEKEEMMLASEEHDLQSALAHMQQAAEERALELEQVTSYLEAAKKHAIELEMKLCAVSTSQEETKDNNIELTNTLNCMQLQLQEKARSYEDLEEENVKLQERLDVLLTHKADMKVKMQELNDMKELLTEFKLERHTLEEDLKVKSSQWNEKVQQLLGQVKQLRAEEKEEQLTELPHAQPPAGPSQAEAQALPLQKELKNLEEQLQTAVKETQSVDLQNLEQQQQLWLLEKNAEVWEEDDQHRLKMLETMEKEHETMQCSLVAHNRELPAQLAQLQETCHRLSAEKEELASLLHSEQQGKKHAGEAAAARGEDGRELHERYLAQLQELRATCEQHLAANQQLSTEKEALQQRLQRQTQLLQQLQQEQVQNQLTIQTVPQKLQATLSCLEATRQENKQLRAQLSCLAFPREGEAVTKEEEGEEATPAAVTVPADVDNPQTMWDFYRVAPSVAESKKLKLSQQLREQQARCKCLHHLTAHCQKKLKRQGLLPKIWNHGTSGKIKQDTRVPEKKLKICFTYNLPVPDKLDHQHQVDDLQRQCSQLSEQVSAMEDSIVFYKEQLEVLDELYREKDESVNQLSQDKRQKKQELQELLLHLAGKDVEGQDKTLAAAHSPATEAMSPLAGPKMDISEDQQGFEDNMTPAQVEAGPLENPTAEQMGLPLPYVQHHQELAGLRPEPSYPVFSRLTRMLNLQY